MRFCLLVFAAVFAILLSPIMVAQVTVQTGSIVGTVTDPSGAAVPNAKVVITNTNNGQSSTINTNAAGVYTAGALTPGVYKVQGQFQRLQYSE
jgi:protocatechuate 3,4-dioxygenase beta subunit